jgi:hypothetical protein
MLPLSHDEVVHGKSPMIYKMPGDEWQKFANLRLLYTYMYMHPGAKLLFMGNEFAATTEWNYKSELPWHLLEHPSHGGMKYCVQKLNELYTSHQALYELLTSTNQIGFELGKIAGVHAMTDITGFGFLGHLLEVCKASGVGAEIEFMNVPLKEEAKQLASSFVLPDNAMRNWNAYEKDVQLSNQDSFAWIVDPQTNGGLLVAVDPSAVALIQEVFNKNGLTSFIEPIGVLETAGEKVVVVKFIKQNGLERIMRCTLDFNKIPVPDRPKQVNIEKILKRSLFQFLLFQYLAENFQFVI